MLPAARSQRVPLGESGLYRFDEPRARSGDNHAAFAVQLPQPAEWLCLQRHFRRKNAYAPITSKLGCRLEGGLESDDG